MIRRMVMKRFISLLTVLVITSALLIGTGVSAASLSGDANGDGEIDNKDVVVLFRFLSGSTKNVVEDNCDYNNDGEINNKDVTVLFRFLSGSNPSSGGDEFVIKPDSSATLAVSHVFGDHMVIQRDSAVKVWGTSNKNGAKVRGRFMGDEAVGTVKNGKWEIEFSAKQATKESQTLTVEDTCGNTVSFTDVLVGDVWIIGGQSNAKVTISYIKQSVTVPKNLPLRVFMQDENDVLDNREAAKNPCEDVINPKRIWRTASKISASTFSALGWYFGSRLASDTDVPVGAICMAAGAASIAELMPKELADEFGYVKGIFAAPGEHYNGLMHPFLRMKFKGMVFFQGEAEGGTNSVPSSPEYARDFEALMTELRSRWGFDFPIYNVQISDYPGEETETNWTHVGEVRTKQYDAYKNMAGVRLIPSFDLGSKSTDREGAHSPYKKELADRIADLVLADIYGIGSADKALAPEPESVTVVSSSADEKVIDIKFKNTGSGLVSLSKTDVVSGFACGETEHPYDDVLTEVSGKITSADTVRVTVPGDAEYIGYACMKRTATENDVLKTQLYSSNNLPALAFYLELK